jgi:hypothetical protein
VNEKTFAYLSAEGEPFSISVKLPYTSYEALKLPFANPTAIDDSRFSTIALHRAAAVTELLKRGMAAMRQKP